MRFFVPDIRVASELPAQSRPEDKLGGLPWGLGKRWPTCSHCGKSQSLLAQLLHDPDRLDLGKAGRVLSVFQCNHDPGGCPTWQGGGGANACFVTDSEDLESALSPLPADKPPIEREVRIVAWLARDDGIPESLAVAFFSDESYLALPEAEIEKVSSSTRLGGVPHWLQSADEAPRDGWRFVGQLATTYDFFSPPIIVEEGITPDRSRRGGPRITQMVLSLGMAATRICSYVQAPKCQKGGSFGNVDVGRCLTTRSSGPRAILGRVSRGKAVGMRPLN